MTSLTSAWPNGDGKTAPKSTETLITNGSKPIETMKTPSFNISGGSSN